MNKRGGLIYLGTLKVGGREFFNDSYLKKGINLHVYNCAYLPKWWTFFYIGYGCVEF